MLKSFENRVNRAFDTSVGLNKIGNSLRTIAGKPARGARFSVGDKVISRSGEGTDLFTIVEVGGINPHTGQRLYVGKDSAGEEWGIDEGNTDWA